MKLLYFAWLRQHVGVSEETVDCPAGVETVGQLVHWLSERGPGYARAFEHPARVRCAVNQAHARPDARVSDGDEVAFFPPVTGG